MTENLINTISWIWMALGALTFIVLQFKTAPYGRHHSNQWGPVVSNRLGWIIMEAVSPAVLLLTFMTGSGYQNDAATLLAALWVIHYINRSFIFPFRIRTSQRKMPVVIMLSAMFFNSINASLNGFWLGNFADFPELNQYLNQPVHIIGLLLFMAGFYINNWADHRLINLRKPGETAYVIPKGGLFNLISCPNHFGEIMEWLGFALAVGSLPAWSFALWTFFNLAPRAVAHHRWYKEKFEDYPPERKALIPWVW